MVEKHNNLLILSVFQIMYNSCCDWCYCNHRYIGMEQTTQFDISSRHCSFHHYFINIFSTPYKGMIEFRKKCNSYQNAS